MLVPTGTATDRPRHAWSPIFIVLRERRLVRDRFFTHEADGFVGVDYFVTTAHVLRLAVVILHSTTAAHFCIRTLTLFVNIGEVRIQILWRNFCICAVLHWSSNKISHNGGLHFRGWHFSQRWPSDGTSAIDQSLVSSMKAPRLTVVGAAFDDDFLCSETKTCREMVVCEIGRSHDVLQSNSNEFAPKFEVKGLEFFQRESAVSVGSFLFFPLEQCGYPRG